MCNCRCVVTTGDCSEPCTAVEILSPSLLSIFKSFYNGSDTEKFYCFKKFHEQPYEKCNTQSCGCSITFVDGNENERCCSHGRDCFDALVDSVIKEMCDIMVAPPLQERVADVEEMARQIKNELYIVKLVKDSSAHCAVRYVNINKSGISINVSRGVNDTSTPDANFVIRSEESANIGMLLKTLITMQRDAMSDEMVEKKLKSVLIHELRHIWQMVQSKLLPSSEMGQWQIRDINGAIDIMTEVDAFKVQRIFEKKNGISITNKALFFFGQVDNRNPSENANSLREKADFLWNKYKYGEKRNETGQFIFRNSFGLGHPPSNTTQPPLSPAVESLPTESRE